MKINKDKDKDKDQLECAAPFVILVQIVILVFLFTQLRPILGRDVKPNVTGEVDSLSGGNCVDKARPKNWRVGDEGKRSAATRRKLDQELGEERVAKAKSGYREVLEALGV